MNVNLFLVFVWITTVYQTECRTSQGKLNLDRLSESEPHPYTISFFTFPQGAVSELFKPKIETKRQNEDLSGNQNTNRISEEGSRQAEDTSGSATNATFDSLRSGDHRTTPVESSSSKVMSRVSPKFSKLKGLKQAVKVSLKHKQDTHPFVQVYEKPNSLDKAGKAPNVGPEKGRHRVDPWKFGSSHNKIQVKVHQMETNEPYQAGSIHHPLHTMYPLCHHCQSNSTYEECTSRSTLSKCNKGLNNICFTKSFRSANRGILYEMGCSNHLQCKKAKALPCKGNAKKCFVCCQYDGCNAVPLHNRYSSESSDETEFEFLNEATIYSSSRWITGTLVFLQVMLWMTT